MAGGRASPLGRAPNRARGWGRRMNKKIIIDLNRQVLFAYEGDELVHKFDCATGAGDTPTPTGRFQVSHKFRHYTSRTYGVAMNNAMFFNFFEGIAIHEAFGVLTTSYLKFAGVDSVGSHGCVRLSQRDARTLFDWAPVGTSVEVR